MTALATLTAISGFIMQFVGLRALHWLATIYQLGVILILTIIRSVVRRGLAEHPRYCPLLDGHELSWPTLYVVGKDTWLELRGEPDNYTRRSTKISPARQSSMAR